METHNKLLEQFKNAAEQDETKPFAASEKVWQQIERKLDDKSGKKFIPWLRYASIAAAILLLATVGLVIQLNKPETAGREIVQNNPASKTENITAAEKAVTIDTKDDSGSINSKGKGVLKINSPHKAGTLESREGKAAATNSDNLSMQLDKLPSATIAPLTIEQPTSTIQSNDFNTQNLSYQKSSIKLADNYLKKLNQSDSTIALNDKQYKSSLINKQEIPQSINTVSAADIEKRPITNVVKALEGSPGIQITNGDGQPGAAPQIIIRGECSGCGGDWYGPLIVIDGAPYYGNLSYDDIINLINPTDIKNITVLKAAVATSLYGSRGSNGVILITTKEGKGRKYHKHHFFRRLFGKWHKD